jgi:hypothetical protein
MALSCGCCVCVCRVLVGGVKLIKVPSSFSRSLISFRRRRRKSKVHFPPSLLPPLKMPLVTDETMSWSKGHGLHLRQQETLTV